MIASMARSVWVLALAFAVGCGSSRSDSKQPHTAREKQRQEARASGELDAPNSKWAGWRYQGDRGDCFYVFGRKCFKTKDAACKAARCNDARTCKTTGAGPATISCAK